MEILKAPQIERPEFVSEVTIKVRPEMKVVSLSGKGDPMLTFDQTISNVLTHLGNNWKPVSHTLGIYYKNRSEVGVENVEWDACVPVTEETQAGDKLKHQVLPESKVTSVVLTGGYNLIGSALKYLESVTAAHGIKTAWPLTEIYIEEGEKPVTELQYFVKPQDKD